MHDALTRKPDVVEYYVQETTKIVVDVRTGTVKTESCFDGLLVEISLYAEGEHIVDYNVDNDTATDPDDINAIRETHDLANIMLPDEDEDGGWRLFYR